MERPLTPRCAICATTQQLLRCAKCKAIYYCSTGHQLTDWPSHRQDCRQLAKMKSSTRMQQLQQAVAATTLSNAAAAASTSASAPTTAASALDGSAATNVGLANGRTHTNTAAATAAASRAPPSSSATQLSVIMGSDGPSADGQDQVNLPLTLSNEPAPAQMSTHTSQVAFGGGGEVDLDAAVRQPPANRVPQVIQAGRNQLPPEQEQDELSLLHHEPQEQAGSSHHHQVAPPQMMLSNHNQNQIEKSSSYQIGSGNGNAIGNANERSDEELCRNVIRDMDQYGLCVVDDFLGGEKGLQILSEVHRMYAAGVFRDGQLVNNSYLPEEDLRTIRGDKITWVKGVEAGCANVGYLINQIDAVIFRANTMRSRSKMAQYNIKERTKAMVACYPGSGSHYVMHVDNPNRDGRVITAIYYLNVNWDTESSGGVLRIFPEHSNTVADIEPKFDRLIFFWSDKRNPHEVQPAHRTRYAITVWYFDAQEREAALSRYAASGETRTNGAVAGSNQGATTTTTTTATAQPAALAGSVAAPPLSHANHNTASGSVGGSNGTTETNSNSNANPRRRNFSTRMVQTPANTSPVVGVGAVGGGAAAVAVPNNSNEICT